MPAGRPLKYSSVEELSGIGDGNVEVNAKGINSKDFKQEKNLEEYIVENIEAFTLSILNDNLVSYEVNMPINYQRFGPRGRRVDLFIKGEKSVYIIELKNPSSGTESRAAIGQILDYGREFLDPKKELIIVTTSFDDNTAKTIAYYNLPIRYIYIDKKRSLEFLNFLKND